ncbi:hypothetical protein PENSPDRAFT_679864 [Peniophora sp. CONT]|nr:hypothetical protein PENSPDRAFT_679864 [Peniophora sp. CONT]
MSEQDGSQPDSRVLLATVATITLATSSALLWQAKRSADISNASSSSSVASAQSMLSSFASWCSRTTPSAASTSEAVTEHSIQSADADAASKVAGSSKSARSKDRRRRNKDLTAKDMRKVKDLLKPTRPTAPTTPTVVTDAFEDASSPSSSHPRARTRSTSTNARASAEDVTPVPTPPKEDPPCSISGRAEGDRHRPALPELDMLAESSVESSSVASSILLAPPSVSSSLSSPPRSVSRASASTSTSAWDSSWDRDGLVLSPPTATAHIHTRAVSPTPPRFLAACAAPGSSSRADSRSPGPALSSQTQLAALKGALEASRLREEKLRADAEREAKQRGVLQWQWREESNAWRRREAELQSHIHYLTHSLHVSAAQLAAAAPPPPAFSPLSPLSPPYSPYSQPQMPVSASAYAPPPLAALELARSFPPPPSSVGSGSAGGSPDRGRRRGRFGSESPELEPEEEEELELSDEVADAILKRPDSIKRIRRKLSNTSSSDGERPTLETLRFPSIENYWVDAQREDKQ